MGCGAFRAEARRTTMKQMRAIGAFIMNLVLADPVCAAIAYPFTVGDARTPMSKYVATVYLLNTATALGLGVFVYWKFRSASAKWVWIFGLCLLSIRVIHLWNGQHLVRTPGVSSHSLFWQLSGTGCNFDTNSCGEWMYVTIPTGQTMSYSIGAWTCSKWKSAAKAAVSALMPPRELWKGRGDR